MTIGAVIGIAIGALVTAVMVVFGLYGIYRLEIRRVTSCNVM